MKCVDSARKENVIFKLRAKINPEHSPSYSFEVNLNIRKLYKAINKLFILKLNK